LRGWLGSEFGKGSSVQAWWGVFFHGIAILLAMIAVTVIYRWARPRNETLMNVLPGALIATLLWWVADVGFGYYVRKMPYGIIYGGLAAVIGLLIWMELSTVIIFLGAACNAELADSRKRGGSY
jgi:membrane protein